MKAFAQRAGTFKVQYGIQEVEVPRLQLLTVKDILEGGKQFETPFRLQRKKAGMSQDLERANILQESLALTH